MLDLAGGSDEAVEVSYFIAAILVPSVDEAANLALECMFDGHDSAASIAEGWYVQCPEVVTEADVVEPLLGSEVRPVEIFWVDVSHVLD